MPKLSRWITVSRKIPLFSKELEKELLTIGVNFGPAKSEVSQTLHVNPANREQVIEMLEKQGYGVCDAGDPDCK